MVKGSVRPVKPVRTTKVSTMKGQAAIEFYAFLGVFLLMFAFIGLTFLSQASMYSNRVRQEVGREVSAAYADMVNFAAVGGNGFYGYFRPPSDKILDNYYDMTFNGSMRVVIVNGTSSQGDFVFIHPIITGDIVVSGVAGSGTYHSDTVDCINVTNINGTVYISVVPVSYC